MPCIFEITLSVSDVIAIVAALVAGLSALYARWSWHETKRANKISLLQHQKEIWDAFFELKMHMTQKAKFAELKEVSKFYYHARNAKIYFPRDLSEQIEKYYEACFWISDIHRKTGGASAESTLEAEPHIKTEEKLAPTIESKILEILQSAQA